MDNRPIHTMELTLSELDSLMDAKVTVSSRINPGEKEILRDPDGGGEPGVEPWADVESIGLVLGDGTVVDISSIITKEERFRLADRAIVRYSERLWDNLVEVTP